MQEGCRRPTAASAVHSCGLDQRDAIEMGYSTRAEASAAGLPGLSARTGSMIQVGASVSVPYPEWWPAQRPHCQATLLASDEVLTG